MKRFLLVALVLFSVGVSRADLVLETADNASQLGFQEEGRVYFEACPKGAKAQRGCSGKSLGELYSTDVDRFVRSVQSFYGLVDRQFGGIHGAAELDAKIQNLQRHLESDTLSAAELKKAEEVVLNLVRKQDKLDAAHRDILRYLVRGTDGSLNSEVQESRYNVVMLSFYPVVYLAGRHQIFRFSDPVSVDKVDGACQQISKEWHFVGGSIDRGLREELATTPIIAPGETTRVWVQSTNPTGGGHYKVTCPSSGYPYGPTTEHFLSPDDYATKSARAARAGRDICYTLPSSSGAPAVGVEFVPDTIPVLDLGAVALEASDQKEAVQAGDGVLSGGMHPVLCQKNYDYKPAGPEDGYLNGDHFADFSIYTLEESLEKTAKSVYANRAEFFRAVSKALGEYPLRNTDDIALSFHTAGARLFVLLAMEPLLHDIQSKFVDNYVLPDYNRAKQQWSKRLHAETLVDIDLSPPTYRLALTLLTYGLKASQAYLNSDDKKDIEALLPALGKAMAAGPKGLSALVPELQKARPLFDHLTEARRVHGFGVMSTAVADYLLAKGGVR